MRVPEIDAVKEKLEALKQNGLLAEWALPYENLLTRLNAAIFFITVGDAVNEQEVWSELQTVDNFSFRANTEAKLSTLQYRVTFSKEEKEKNQQQQAALA